MRRARTCAGNTLAEVVIAMAILTTVLIPLTLIISRTAYDSKGRDLQIAYAIMRGECNVICRTHKLPEPESEWVIDGAHYRLLCSHDADACVRTWTLGIEKGKRSLARISGIVFAPDNTPVVNQHLTQ